MFKKIVEHSNFHKSALKFEHSTVNHFIHYHFIERKDSENFQNFLRFNKWKIDFSGWDSLLKSFHEV